MTKKPSRKALKTAVAVAALQPPYHNISIKRTLMAPSNCTPGRLISMATTNSTIIEAIYNKLLPGEVLAFLAMGLYQVTFVHKATLDPDGRPIYDYYVIRNPGPLTPTLLAQLQQQKGICILNPGSYNAFYARALLKRTAHEPRHRV